MINVIIFNIDKVNCLHTSYFITIGKYKRAWYFTKLNVVLNSKLLVDNRDVSTSINDTISINIIKCDRCYRRERHTIRAKRIVDIANLIVSNSKNGLVILIRSDIIFIWRKKVFIILLVIHFKFIIGLGIITKEGWISVIVFYGTFNSGINCSVESI